MSNISATRILCSDNRDELIDKIIVELGKSTAWIKSTSNNGKTRISFVEDPLSKSIHSPQVHLEFISK